MRLACQSKFGCSHVLPAQYQRYSFPCVACSSPQRPCNANHLRARRTTTQSHRALSRQTCKANSLSLGQPLGLRRSVASFSQAEVRSLKVWPLVRLAAVMARIPCVFSRLFVGSCSNPLSPSTTLRRLERALFRALGSVLHPQKSLPWLEERRCLAQSPQIPLRYPLICGTQRILT